MVMINRTIATQLLKEGNKIKYEVENGKLKCTICGKTLTYGYISELKRRGLITRKGTILEGEFKWKK